MKRYNVAKELLEKSYLVEDKDIDLFLGEVLAICKRYGLCIYPEDYEGSLVVTRYNERDALRLRDAQVDIKDYDKPLVESKEKSDDKD